MSMCFRNMTSAPVTLYHCLNARSFRPLWLLEHLKCSYDLVVLPFPPRVQEKKFLQVNPLGTVPFLIHGDTKLTESVAMCQYLASKFDPLNNSGLCVLPHEKDYGQFLNWMHHGESTLTFPITIYLRYEVFSTPETKQPVFASDYAKWFQARLKKGLETHLSSNADQKYLCGDRLTIADISVAYALMLSRKAGLVIPPNSNSYLEHLMTLDSFQAAVNAQMSGANTAGIDISKEFHGAN